jgi:phosphotransferase system enzyme I (PtsI)
VRLTGLGVSPGIGVGTALVLKHGARDVRFLVPEALVPRELRRFEQARARAREQIEHIKARMAGHAGGEHAYLFDAQLLMLDDAMLVERTREIIRRERLNAESALRRALDQISALFGEADDAYLREREGDVADVVGRLCMNLRAGDPGERLKDLEGPLVLVGDEIPPSTLAQLDWRRLAGIVTDTGSWTHHTAILARSIGVPAVAALHQASALIRPGATVVVDGVTGVVHVEPDADTLRAVHARQEQQAASDHALDEFRHAPALTADGVSVRLEGNIQSPEDVANVRQQGGEGVGLFRSEFLLVDGRQAAPTEEAQYLVYRRLVEAMGPGRVTVRTFDVSEPRLRIDQASGEGSRAPLGLRGVRLSLTLEVIFEAQLRALLRAAVHGPLRIMFPFVSGAEELAAARAAVARAAASLRARGIDVPDVPVGVMIEVPSAALTADLLAEQADFFSIGTNDLIQYSLAVDRTDDRVSRLYEPYHPAIIRTLRLVARAARRRGIPVAVCGEIAADPVLLTLLVGLGITEFSMAPGAIPLAKRALRGLRSADAAAAARRALRARTVAEVEEALTGETMKTE